MRGTPRPFHLLGALIVVGCYAYRPVAVPPAPDSRVRIVFTRAMTVTTMTVASDSAHHAYPGVLEASGITQGAAADTLALRLGELRTAAGRVEGVAGQVALLPTARIARIEQRRFQAGTTALTGVGVALIALATFVIVLIATLTKGF